MADSTPRIKCTENGPYLIKGPLEILDPTGELVTVPSGETAALCRCGGSANKPFCDGTHSKTGFQASEAAPQRSD